MRVSVYVKNFIHQESESSIRSNKEVWKEEKELIVLKVMVKMGILVVFE